ncbi:TPA: plantaricin C family lantibiotic [Bacillus cereus]
MTKELKALKNPYYRHQNNVNVNLPVENPLKELNEDEMSMFGGAAEPRTIGGFNSADYAILSLRLGNNGYICTYTVECQKNCN